MRRIKLTLAYDGTNYSGWQVQPNAVSIQALIQKALERMLRHSVALSGSGRTDAGVHAEGQTAHFDTDSTLSPFRLRHSLNALLPPDIRILDAAQVPNDFHARYSAKGKIYHYHIHLARESNPMTRLYRTPILGPFDREAFEQAALHFPGTHDFASFANEAHRGAAALGSIRTLRRLEIFEQSGGLRLEFEGDGFLYKMVRNIVGTLLETAKGKRTSDEIPQLFEEKDRKKAGATAPAQGLFLMKVLY